MSVTIGASVDLLTLGHQLRHHRRARKLTLAQLAERVGCAPSLLSLVENGHREPKLSLLQSLAEAFDVNLSDLLATEPPTQRAALEITLEQAQRAPSYRSLGLPAVRLGRRLPVDALEALVGLHRELAERASMHAATPEEARRANVDLRHEMRARDNYYAEIDEAADTLLDAVGHRGGPLSRRVIDALAGHLGFTLEHVPDLPHSTRSVTDLRNRRIYLPVRPTAGHDPRAVALQTFGHFVLGHTHPDSHAAFLRQRIEVNYFAAALLVPERHVVPLLQEAKAARDLSVDDIRDAFAVSYETAAHRFTNLATRHLGLAVHFMKVHESGTIYKAYENDGVIFPTDVFGAIEGQPVCRQWTARAIFGQPDPTGSFHQYTDTPNGTYWCTALAESTPAGNFSISVGVPFAASKWFRGRESRSRATSRCPDESCCRRPPPELAHRWDGQAWPSARSQSHLLATLPPGTFPGVDDTEVYTFLETRGARA